MKNDHRGRPKENDKVLVKFQVKTKDHTGLKAVYSFDREISNKGMILWKKYVYHSSEKNMIF